jgi:dTDP-4-dehydrorhamnose reductase
MKIMINGAGGMLGQAVHEVFSGKAECIFTDKDVNERWLELLDFRDRDEYQRQALAFRPHIIVHLGAYTDLEYCEKNSHDAYRTNTLSVEHAISISKKIGAKLIYISTAGIFDGKQDYYDEVDVPNPLGVYARSKYWGEKSVLANSPESLVVRAGWMMGGGIRKDKKFVKKIVSQIESGKRMLNVVNDKLGTPTYTFDFAENLWNLINHDYFGLFNMVSSGFTSRLDVARAIVEELNVDVEVLEVSSDFFPDYFAPRPECERLINRRLDMYGVNNMRHWRQSLNEYLKCKYFI